MQIFKLTVNSFHVLHEGSGGFLAHIVSLPVHFRSLSSTYRANCVLAVMDGHVGYRIVLMCSGVNRFANNVNY